MTFKTLQTGYEFSQIWPKHEPYLAMFEQTKAVKLASLSMTVMPSFAVVTAFLQFKFFGTSQLNLTLAMTILFLSIPIHGFYLLGKKASSSLPSSLRSWYRELEAKKTNENSEKLNAISKKHTRKVKMDSKLTFMDLACVLNDVFMAEQHRQPSSRK